jgi:NADH-quinone oxidoreductase subunit A
MMRDFLLAPPIAFLIVLIFSWLLSQVSSLLAYRSQHPAAGLEKAYTGGEEVATSRVQPDYSQFFPFAFFFTILHVVTLMVTTVPATETVGAYLMALLYIAGAGIGLFILLRK